MNTEDKMKRISMFLVMLMTVLVGCDADTLSPNLNMVNESGVNIPDVPSADSSAADAAGGDSVSTDVETDTNPIDVSDASDIEDTNAPETTEDAEVETDVADADANTCPTVKVESVCNESGGCADVWLNATSQVEFRVEYASDPEPECGPLFVSLSDLSGTRTARVVLEQGMKYRVYGDLSNVTDVQVTDVFVAGPGLKPETFKASTGSEVCLVVLLVNGDGTMSYETCL